MAFSWHSSAWKHSIWASFVALILGNNGGARNKNKIKTNKKKHTYGGALKERRNGRAGKRSSKHLKMDNKLSTKKPAARLPRNDSHLLDQGHLWFQALCARRLWTENVLFGAHRRTANTRPLWLGQSYQGLKLCDSTLSSLFGTEHGALPGRQGWTPRNTTKRSALEMQGKNPQFFGQSFRTRSVLSKTCQWTLQKAVMDSPFCSWTVRSAEKSHFGENVCSPTDDFGGSKMRGYHLGRILVGVPVFALGVCVSTFDWRFLAVGCKRSHE